MELKDYMAISGKPGLYKFISQGRNAMIVENLDTETRISVFATDKVSALSDIAVFTEDEEVPLKDVLKSIHEKENGEACISYKSAPEQLKTGFESVLPAFDRERVYVSDMKTIARWYNTLQKLDLLDFSEPQEEEAEEATVESEKPAGAKANDEKKDPPRKKSSE